jgi:hypothetical protein
MMRGFLVLTILVSTIGCVLMASCGRQPGAFPIPPQRSLDLGQDPGGLGPFITMDDPAADEYIVRDISPASGHHRWAFLHPELRFRIKEAGYSKFAADFAIPEVTFKVTGPVTVSAAVEGRSIGTIRCDHAGDYLMEKAVPAEVLQAGKEVHVTFDTHPRWVSPDDGAELSFFLRSAGFTR